MPEIVLQDLRILSNFWNGVREEDEEEEISSLLQQQDVNAQIEDAKFSSGSLKI